MTERNETTDHTANLSASPAAAGVRRQLPPEAEIAVPALPVISVCTLVPVLGAAAWAGFASGLGYSSQIVMTGVLGGALVLAITMVALVVTSPWTRRPISMHMTMWLAGTVIRLLATPAGAFLLYSAAPLDGTALTLSVGGIHLATLLTEAAVMSRLLGRAIMPA